MSSVDGRLVGGVVAAFGLWSAYCFHGVVVERGVVGWIQALMFEWTGSAGVKLPFLLALFFVPLALFVPALVLLLVVGAVMPKREARVPDTTHATNVVRPEPRTVNGRRTQALWAFGLLGAGAALVALAFGPAYPASPPAQVSTRLALDDAPAALPEGTWVGLVGTVQGRSAIGFRKGTEVHTYVPLTTRGWAPGEPVRVVWDAGKATRAPEPGTPLVVRLRETALPLYAQRAFEKRGVHLATPYWLAEAEREPDAMIALLVAAALLLFFGGGFAWGLLTRTPVRL